MFPQFTLHISTVTKPLIFFKQCKHLYQVEWAHVCCCAGNREVYSGGCGGVSRSGWPLHSTPSHHRRPSDERHESGGRSLWSWEDVPATGRTVLMTFCLLCSSVVLCSSFSSLLSCVLLLLHWVSFFVHPCTLNYDHLLLNMFLLVDCFINNISINW